MRTRYQGEEKFCLYRFYIDSIWVHLGWGRCFRTLFTEVVMPINLGSTTTTHGSHPVFISTLISHLMLHQDKRVNLIFFFLLWCKKLFWKLQVLVTIIYCPHNGQLWLRTNLSKRWSKVWKPPRSEFSRLWRSEFCHPATSYRRWKHLMTGIEQCRQRYGWILSGKLTIYGGREKNVGLSDFYQRSIISMIVIREEFIPEFKHFVFVPHGPVYFGIFLVSSYVCHFFVKMSGCWDGLKKPWRVTLSGKLAPQSMDNLEPASENPSLKGSEECQW